MLLKGTRSSILYRRSGRSLSMFVGLLFVFALSALLGFYIVGPKVAERASATPQPPSQPPPVETSERGVLDANPRSPETAPDDRLRIDINERDTARVSRNKPTEKVLAKPDSTDNRITDTESGLIVSEATPAKQRPSATPVKATAPIPTPSASSVRTDNATIVKKSASGTAESAKTDLYRVQVGVFADADHATQMADQLKTMGQIAHVKKTSLKGREVYQVQAGIFRSKENADKLSQKLNEEGVETSVLSQPEENKPE